MLEGHELQSRQRNGPAAKFGSEAGQKASVQVSYYWFQVTFKIKKAFRSTVFIMQYIISQFCLYQIAAVCLKVCRRPLLAWQPIPRKLEKDSRDVSWTTFPFYIYEREKQFIYKYVHMYIYKYIYIYLLFWAMCISVVSCSSKYFRCKAGIPTQLNWVLI